MISRSESKAANDGLGRITSAAMLASESHRTHGVTGSTFESELGGLLSHTTRGLGR
jgi:hypothetical protein